MFVIVITYTLPVTSLIRSNYKTTRQIIGRFGKKLQKLISKHNYQSCKLFRTFLNVFFKRIAIFHALIVEIDVVLFH